MCELQARPASSNLAAHCKASFLQGLELETPRWPSLIIKLAAPTRPGPSVGVRGGGGRGRIGPRDPSLAKDALGEQRTAAKGPNNGGGRARGARLPLPRRRRRRARPPPTAALPARVFALAWPAAAFFPSGAARSPARRPPRRLRAPPSPSQAGPPPPPPPPHYDTAALPSATPA